MEDWFLKNTIRMGYSDFFECNNIREYCRKNKVIFDFNLYDIPATMRHNIKTCADIGAFGITVANHPGNALGIKEAYLAGVEYDIEIIMGEHLCISQRN